MAAGASPSKGDDVLIVVDNDYERRYFYSATSATRGLGWFNFKAQRGVPAGTLKVYRLDEEASQELTRKIVAAPNKHDPTTGNWLKATADNYKNIFVKVTGIRRS